VESHANTVGALTLEFASQIPGRLEVAMGLETVHPGAAAHLNKRLDLPRFDRAARFLADNDIDLRVFVLLGAPYVPANESVDWAVRTAEYAAQRGASVVSIIPVRRGNGEIERLEALGHFTAPTLSQLEQALDRCTGAGAGLVVFTADLWDVDRLPACPACRERRIDRLRRLNVGGSADGPVSCARCGTG
jgi:archaeosine synthase beta-subunit